MAKCAPGDCPDVRACALGGCFMQRSARVVRHEGRCQPEDVEMNVEGYKLLGMAVAYIRQLETGNPFAKMAGGDFRRALGYADLSEEYLATLDPLALPFPESKPVQGVDPK